MGRFCESSSRQVPNNHAPAWLDHMLVDLVSDLLGKMRCPVGKAFAWKCGRFLDKQKLREYRASYNDQWFHLLSLLFTD